MISKTLIAFAILLLTLPALVPLQTSSTISFHVQNYANGQALAAAAISLTGNSVINQNTDSDGNLTLTIPYGTYQITVSKSTCTAIGPQSFIVDQTAPPYITVKLQCS